MRGYWAAAFVFAVVVAAVSLAGWMITALGDDDDAPRQDDALIDAQRAIVVPTSENTRKLVVPACDLPDGEVDEAVPSEGPHAANELVLPPGSATRTVLLPSCGDPDDVLDSTRDRVEQDTRAGLLVLPPGATVAGTDDPGEGAESSLRPQSVLIVPGDSEAAVIRVSRCPEDADVEEHVTLADPDGDGVIQAPECGA